MTKRIWILATALAFTAIAHAATNDLTGLLQQGLFEEEANRNLDAAISNYQSLANAFDKDRQVAATAIFRLGECYRKLGHTNEAAAQYQRIVRDFSDQQTLVTLSQQNLVGLGAPSSPQATSSAIASDSLQQLQSALVKDKTEYSQKNAILLTLKKLKPHELRKALPTVVPDDRLNTLLSELDLAQQNLLQLKPEYAPEHPKVKNAQEQVDDLQLKVDDRINGIMAGLQAQLEASQAHQKWLENEIQKAGASNAAQPGNAEQPPITDEEEREIRRIQQMIQNSPDLINAPGGDPSLTPLARAASLGQLSVAKFLLNAKADVNQQSGGVAPLQYAAINGHRAMVDLLLAHGGDVNAKDWEGRTSLHSAAEHGFVSVAEALLASKADINAQDSLGNTPLTLAVRGGFLPVAELLLSHGADPNLMVNKVQESSSMSDINVGAPLHFAVNKGDEPMVSLLLSNHANVDLRSPNRDKTALEMAAERGTVEIARHLLDAGANPNPDPKDLQDTGPLSRAANAGKADMVHLLLARGADPNGGFYWKEPSGKYQGPQGYTPLSTAVMRNYEEVVTDLLRGRADPNIKNSDGSSTFQVGLNVHGARSLIPLLENGADPNQPENNGALPLIRVIQANTFLSDTDRVSVAKVLIEKGADVNAKDLNGNTALHWAVLHGKPELLELLLANKADVNAQNQQKKTPLDLAKAGAHGSIPRSLLYGGGGTSSWGTDSEKEQNIAALLTQAGGVADLPQLDQIQVARPSANFSQTIFWQPTNNWNQVSLFDVLGVQYELISGSLSSMERHAVEYSGQQLEYNSLSFPDLKRIVIHRPIDRGVKWQDLPIDADRALNSGDCTADVLLQFGDIIEIPEADHVINEQWTGLESNILFNLAKCVTRHVQIIVKGQSSTVTIAPDIEPVRELTRNYIKIRPFKPVMLWPALQESKLLLWSSDLSRIKVKRHDLATGKTLEWTVDCSNPQSPPNFWLRDGDVIEVPEKSGE